MRTRTFLIAALAAAAILPGSAHAATLGVDNGTLRYAADPGERNDFGLGVADDGDFVIYENLEGGRPGVVRLGPGCRRDGMVTFRCESDGVTAADAALGDLDDTLCVSSASIPPARYSGGDGRDLGGHCVFGQPGVSLDNDGVADDGPTRRDNYLPDIEILLGTSSADELGAGPTGAELRGRDGSDRFTGGAGNDVMHAAYVEDVGIELGDFSSGGADIVTCGGGADLVLASRDDRVAGDCEVIGKPRSRDLWKGYGFRGSRRSDTIEPPLAWEPAYLYGERGNDTLRDGKRMYGGRGADRIIARRFENVGVSGGQGNDRIDVRDRTNDRRRRDTVRCGSGRDRVYAERNDKVADDCERVSGR